MKPRSVWTRWTRSVSKGADGAMAPNVFCHAKLVSPAKTNSACWSIHLEAIAGVPTPEQSVARRAGLVHLCIGSGMIFFALSTHSSKTRMAELAPRAEDAADAADSVEQEMATDGPHLDDTCTVK